MDKIYKKNIGSFIKKCPCSPGQISCNYSIIIPGIGCPYKCSYCFLNFYTKEKVIYSNTDDLIKEFKSFIKEDKLYRFGTGEFTDSLAFKEYKDINLELIKVVKNKPNVVIEFKTKSTNIDYLLKIKAQSNIIVSWSLNPQEIIDLEEPLTPSLSERLSALKESLKHGYPTAIHLDPIFMQDRFLTSYIELIHSIFKIAKPDQIAWLSMGGFRYTDDLKLAILEKEKKWYLGDEFIRCNDGKYRYPRFKRLKFYNTIGELVKKYGQVKTYMCMEDFNMWNSVTCTNIKVPFALHPKE